MEVTEGSVAVVTGGASGIGAALGHSLADAGCSVVLADVDKSDNCTNRCWPGT